MQALRPTRYIDAVPSPAPLGALVAAPLAQRGIPAGIALVLALLTTVVLTLTAATVAARMGAHTPPATATAGTLA